MVNLSDFYSAAAHQDLVEPVPTDMEKLSEANQLVKATIEAPETTKKVPSKRKELTSTAPLPQSKSTRMEHKKKKKVDLIHPAPQDSQADQPSDLRCDAPRSEAQDHHGDEQAIVPELIVMQRSANST